MFVDWLNVWQQFDPAAYPDFLGGRVISVDGPCGFSRSQALDHQTGLISDVWAISGSDDVEYATCKFGKHKGSYETNLMIRMVSGRLEVRGNASAYGRLDNLFGLGLDDCIYTYNEVLRSIGLPVFTSGELNEVFLQSEQSWSKSYTGAHITRVDVTQNNSVGSGRVSDYHRWIAKQKIYRSGPDDEAFEQFARWNFDTVYNSISKTWVNSKHYDKSKALEERTLPEYLKKLNKAVREGTITKQDAINFSIEATDYIEKLAEWCAEVGISRSEWSFRSRWFVQHKGLGYWEPGVTEKALLEHASIEREKLQMRGLVYQVDDSEKLSDREFRVLESWKRGVEVRQELTKPTFYRLRAAILQKTGHDIAARPIITVSDVRPVYFQVRSLSQSDAPSWYRPAHQPLQMAA